MQTLIFDTTKKEVQLLTGSRFDSKIIEHFGNISTVKVMDSFYEVMQRLNEVTSTSIPIMRVPIANTNMIIIK